MGACDKSPKETKGGRSLVSNGFHVASDHLKLPRALTTVPFEPALQRRVVSVHFGQLPKIWESHQMGVHVLSCTTLRSVSLQVYIIRPGTHSIQWSMMIHDRTDWMVSWLTAWTAKHPWIKSVSWLDPWNFGTHPQPRSPFLWWYNMISMNASNIQQQSSCELVETHMKSVLSTVSQNSFLQYFEWKSHQPWWQ